MNFIELVCEIETGEDFVYDLLSAELGEIGFESFEEFENGIKAYITEDKFDFEKVITLNINNFEGVKINYSHSEIQTKNWNEEWEKNYFKPVQVEDLCVIKSTFHTDVPKAKYEISIDPKMSFGTGNHETTWLILSQMFNVDFQDKNILDMGCGTGVLGILASMRGAESIFAVDIDVWSYNNSVENFKINNISKNIEIKQGDASAIKGRVFDIVLANINRNILVNDIPKYAETLVSDGILFTSGYYTEDLEGIKEIAKKSDLKYLDHKEKNNWVAARFIKE